MESDESNSNAKYALVILLVFIGLGFAIYGLLKQQIPMPVKPLPVVAKPYVDNDKTEETNTSAEPNNTDFKPYMKELQRRIKRAWYPPRGQETKRVRVKFKIHESGELADLKLDESSGAEPTDKAAMQAVTNAAPFRPLPSGAPSPIEIEFTFDYNIFSKKEHQTDNKTTE